MACAMWRPFENIQSLFISLTAFRSLFRSMHEPWQSSRNLQSLFDFWWPSDLYVDQGMGFDKTVGNYNHFSTPNSVKSQCWAIMAWAMWQPFENITITFGLLTAFRSLFRSRHEPRQSSRKLQSLFDFWRPSDLYVDQGISLNKAVGNNNRFLTSDSL